MKIVIVLGRFDGEVRSDITSLQSDIDKVLKKYPHIVSRKELII